MKREGLRLKVDKVRLFFLGFLLFASSSCSTLRFQSSGRGQVSTAPAIGEGFQHIVVEGEVTFYAWGQYPSEHVINIDELFFQKGYTELFQLQVEEFQSWGNYLLTAISFGLMNPRNYRLSAYVKKREGQRD